MDPTRTSFNIDTPQPSDRDPIQSSPPKKDSMESARSGAVKAVKILGKVVTREVFGAAMLGVASLAFLTGAGIGIVGQAVGAIAPKKMKANSIKDAFNEAATLAFEVSKSMAVHGVFHIGKGIATPVIDLMDQSNAKKQSLDEWINSNSGKAQKFQDAIGLGTSLSVSNVKVDQATLMDKNVKETINAIGQIKEPHENYKDYGIAYAVAEVDNLADLTSRESKGKRSLGATIGILLKENPGQEITQKMIYLKQAEFYRGAATNLEVVGKKLQADGAKAMAAEYESFAQNPQMHAKMSDFDKIRHAQEKGEQAIQPPKQPEGTAPTDPKTSPLSYQYTSRPLFEKKTYPPTTALVRADSTLIKDEYVNAAINAITVIDSSQFKIMGCAYAIAELETLTPPIADNASLEAPVIRGKSTLGCAIGILLNETPNAKITVEMIFRKQAELYNLAADNLQQKGKAQLAKGASAMANAYNNFVKDSELHNSMDVLQKMEYAQEIARSAIREQA